jgi:uncharacterized OsmC-like protein
VDLRTAQAPLKDGYRTDPASARITLQARGSQTDVPISCSLEVGRTLHEAQAHAGVGGAGTAPCSGDILLGGLAACAQITCQMVAEAMGVALARVEVTVEGDLDLRGTLGVDRAARVGFEQIRLAFELDAPGASEQQLEQLLEKTVRYCVVLQTLRSPPEVVIRRGPETDL